MQQNIYVLILDKWAMNFHVSALENIDNLLAGSDLCATRKACALA